MSKRLFYWPPVIESPFYDPWVFLKMPRQFSDAPRNSQDAVIPVAAHVVILLQAGRPFAVIGFVAFVIILSLKHQSERFFAHIREKIFKPNPSFANCNSAPTVIFPRFVAGIRTPLNHLPPASIGKAFYRMLRVSVFKAYQGLHCGSKASARLRMSIFKGTGSHADLSSALALAHDYREALPARAPTRRKVLDHFKLSKLLSDEALFCRHGIVDSMLCLVAGAQRQLALATRLARSLAIPQCNFPEGWAWDDDDDPPEDCEDPDE